MATVSGSRAHGRIVLLNGASSSGKTSVAKRLQDLSHPEAFLHVSLDAFRSFEPRGYWTSGVDAARKRRIEALCRSINAAAAVFARAGESVIVDHVLPRDAWRWIKEDWAGLPMLFVGLHCEEEVLSRRERDRGDRPIGLAASQCRQIHRDVVYDLELDTTNTSIDDCVATLRAWLSTRPERTSRNHGSDWSRRSE